MNNFGTCKKCGSDLIEGRTNHLDYGNCLTCDHPVAVGLFLTYDTPFDLDVKVDKVYPALSKLYKESEIEGDRIHLIPIPDLEKIDAMIEGFNNTFETEISYELIKI